MKQSHEKLKQQELVLLFHSVKKKKTRCQYWNSLREKSETFEKVSLEGEKNPSVEQV